MRLGDDSAYRRVRWILKLWCRMGLYSLDTLNLAHDRLIRDWVVAAKERKKL